MENLAKNFRLGVAMMCLTLKLSLSFVGRCPNGLSPVPAASRFQLQIGGAFLTLRGLCPLRSYQR
jgi:hypothetical protein